MKPISIKKSLLVLGSAGLFTASSLPAAVFAATTSTNASQIMPSSDPQNTGGWVLNSEISDEFNGKEIDHQKWFVQGHKGQYYIWKGRAPSQFAPHNVIVEDGILKLRSQWEPSFKFAKEDYADGDVTATYGKLDGKPMPVTTAAIVSHKRFLNGYMEVRSKAVNASMTSAFWAIGYQSELDVYEQIGNPKVVDGDIQADQSKSTIHDWSPPAKRPTRVFHHKEKLPYRVADEFHVYGAEWGEDYLNLYLDGKLIKGFTQKELGARWVLTNPMEIWLDSEIFAWLGMPHKEELPADFEVDYVRVWQQPHSNLVDRAFFSFEGPMIYQDVKRPLKLVPENSENNEYQKFWNINEYSAQFASISPEKQIAGTKSLKIAAEPNAVKKDINLVGPKGAMSLPAGNYELSVRVWVDLTDKVKQLQVNLGDKQVKLSPFDLSHFDHAHKAQWITLTQAFTLTKPLAKDAQFSLSVNAKDIEKDGAVLLYVDDIAVKKAK